jgi:hypothetical protein
MSTPKKQSAEKDVEGREYLAEESWQKMGTKTFSSKAQEYIDKITSRVTGDLSGIYYMFNYNSLYNSNYY